MLTAAQQKVKQELEELQANDRFRQKPGDVPPPSKPGTKKRVYLVIILLVILTACSFYYLNYSTLKHKKILSYLVEEDEYNTKSAKSLEHILANKDTNYREAKSAQTALLKKVNSLETISSLDNHKQYFMDVMNQRLELLAYLADSKKIDVSQLDKNLFELMIKRELVADSLRKAFETENIKYVVRDDGSFQYWIDSKSYFYNNK